MERIDLDQKLEYKGYWYLPTAPEDRVAGVLTYHPNEKIILELMGCFGEYSWSILTKREEDPVILGRTADGKDITLINNILKFRKCYAASLNLTFRFISLTMSSSSSMMALRTSGA